MSALPPKADVCGATRDVRYGPKADIGEQAPKLVFHGPCCKPFNASAMALSRLGLRSVAASTGRCHRAPSPRASEGGRSRQSPPGMLPPLGIIFGLFVAFIGRFIHGNEVSPGNLCREPAAVA